MLKRKFFAVALPLVAGATIVGSGFAAWVFNSSEASSSNIDVNVNVTNKVDLKNVSLITEMKLGSETRAVTPKDKFVIVLDQVSRKENETDTNEKGIYLKLKKSGEIVENIQTHVKCTDNSLKNLDSAGYRVSLTTKVTFTTALLEYLDVKTATGWAKNISFQSNTENLETYLAKEQAIDVINNDSEKYYVSGATDFGVTNTGKKSVIITSSKKDDSITDGDDAYFNNSILKWKSGKKPTSPELLDTMIDKLNGKAGFSIEFTLNLTDVNA